MIKNLSGYNAWKRSTLDRLTDQYRRAYVKVYRRHLISIAKKIESSLIEGDLNLSFSVDNITAKLLLVMKNHRQHVIYTAVSDGIREIDPVSKLSTWEKWPYSYPVENTFVTLGEKKIRDNIYRNIYTDVDSKNNSWMFRLVNLDKLRYLKNVRVIYKTAARTYLEDPDSHDTKDMVKDLIARSLKVTETHAETIFRTETTRYFNDARVTYFQSHTEVDFIQLMAVTDGRISNICESRDGYVVPIGRATDKKFKPPFHPNCRTVQSPLDTDLKSDVDEVRKNLGAEFGKVKSETSEHEFTGRRSAPKVQLPKNWS